MASEDPLKQPLQYLPGIGPKNAELLAKLRLQTVEDLLWYLPRDVLDLTHISPVNELVAEELQTVRGTVVDIDVKPLSRGRSMAAVLLDCDGGQLRGVWFNQRWVHRQFQNEQNVLFSGKPKRRGGRWEISHPKIQWLEEDDATSDGGILPRYGLTEGLKMYQLRKFTRAAVEQFADLVPECLPDSFRNEFDLPALPEAITAIHCPRNLKSYKAGCNRLIFDDLLEFQAALAMRRKAWKKEELSPELKLTTKIDARIRRLFPFQFTAGQSQAVEEIAADMATAYSMHRLLQADVGAGKTAVAIYAMLLAIANNHQAALMAPTELLASQHWATIDEILQLSRVDRLLLTGNLTAKERTAALENIQSGEAQLIVGTQALIQKDVRFHKLGLVVIDEQHKFGVQQRARFSMQGVAGNASETAQTPHILVMTATPIPRSICLTQFGDLDSSIISDLPPGRQQVTTSRVPNKPSRDKAWEFIRKQLNSGRQCYVVCPRVEAVEDDGTKKVLASAEQVFEQLRSTELKDHSVGLVHGKLKPQEKQHVMESFRAGEIQALVSTTVIEVGVDVPNATLMVIFQAENFGLSQLHQLRGRIGRGKFQGYCFLFSESATPEAAKRLFALENTTDGFRIAEVDFEIRGPGDVLGTRQHGDLPLKVADLIKDKKLLLPTRKAAFNIVQSGKIDTPDFASFKTRVLERFQQMMDLGKSG